MKTLLLFALLLPAPDASATSPPDTATAPPAARKWCCPKHLVLQTGGGLGMAAAGAGYSLFQDRFETDVLLGYVPKRYAGSTLSLASLKAMYSPWHLRVAEQVQVVPLTAGAYFSYTHGVINDQVKGQYPNDYYWFSTDTRFGVLLGGRLTYLAAPVAATGQPRKLSFYYELGTNDLYVVSLATNLNGGLNLGQILTLALGLKVDI
jgi:hypothetical protein